ncbi:type I restriction endonuclease [Candidatus Poriferisodalis sp.]|uniref:type I restriction endonuclease n=1 Tax=Candidatus Poriferisodalis sp. TaxID=3101277 RepID=UPI003AF4B78A
MELEERLAKVHKELSSGNLRLETNVQVKVVRPILRSLGWDDADSSHMRAEFRIGKRKVDEALLGEFGGPVVFIEAKRKGHLQDRARHDKAVRQLFRYARHREVPILLLTDGETWDFYLRRAPGSSAERRFLRLVLTESVGLEEAELELRTFLGRDAVLEGDALRADEPTGAMERPYSYGALFPEDLPRTDYAREELERLTDTEMAEVIEWWSVSNW